jgi:hypothetical protein
VSTEESPEYTGFVWKGLANGGSIEVDFNDDALYVPYTLTVVVEIFDPKMYRNTINPD